MTMSEILEKKEFPILIQFSTEQIIPDEGKNRDGSPASFLIIASHEEHFIQGNYLLNGTETLDNTTMLDRRLSNVVHFCWANVEPQSGILAAGWLNVNLSIVPCRVGRR